MSDKSEGSGQTPPDAPQGAAEQALAMGGQLAEDARTRGASLAREGSRRRRIEIRSSFNAGGAP